MVIFCVTILLLYGHKEKKKFKNQLLYWYILRPFKEILYFQWWLLWRYVVENKFENRAPTYHSFNLIVKTEPVIYKRS